MGIVNHIIQQSSRTQAKSFKRKEAEKWEATYGCTIIKDDYTSEAELDADWVKFQQNPISMRFLSDDKCMQLYGKENEDMYIDMKHKFLKRDLPNNLDIEYRGEMEDPSTLSNKDKDMLNSITKNIQGQSVDKREELLRDLDLQTDNTSSKYGEGESDVPLRNIYDGAKGNADIRLVDRLHKNEYKIVGIKEDIDPREEDKYVNDDLYPIIPRNIDSLSVLKQYWYRYNSMDNDRRNISDDISRQIYGIDNQEMYTRTLHTLLAQDIEDKEIVEYNPGRIGYYEAVNDLIEDSIDTQKVARYIAKIMDEDTSEFSSVEKSIRKYVIDKGLSHINEVTELGSSYMGDLNPFLTPQEIEDNYSRYDGNYFSPQYPYANSAWYTGFEAKIVGASIRGLYYRQLWNKEVEPIYNRFSHLEDEKEKELFGRKLMECGWIPFMDYTNPEIRKQAANRLNNVLEANISYNFIKMNNIIDESTDNSYNGSFISIAFLYNIDIEKEDSSFVFTIGKLQNEAYTIANGGITKRYLSDYNKDTILSVYTLPISKSIANSLRDILYKINISNIRIMSLLCSLSIKNIIEVSDERQLASYIANCLLNVAMNFDIPSYQQDKFVSAPFDGKKNMYMIYSGEIKNYKSNLSYNAIENINTIKVAESVSDELKPFIELSVIQESDLTHKEFRMQIPNNAIQFKAYMDKLNIY